MANRPMAAPRDLTQEIFIPRQKLGYQSPRKGSELECKFSGLCGAGVGEGDMVMKKLTAAIIWPSKIRATSIDHCFYKSC